METLGPQPTLIGPADLEAAIKEEHFSPALLPYNYDIFNALVGKLVEREAFLASLPPSDQSFSRDLLTLEYDRLLYYLKKYLRLRLAKIEKNILFIFQKDLASLLSKPEFEFALKFYRHFASQLNGEIFSKVDERYGAKLFELNALTPNRSNLGLSMADAPDDNHFVFVRFVDSAPNVVLDRGITMKFSKNDILLVAFKFVRTLVADGIAKLV
jgi:hypothetical protein